MSRATHWLWLTAIALRLAYAPLSTHLDPLLRANPLHGDAVLHDQMAWRLASTGEYQLDKGLMTAPAYIYLMAGVYALAGHAPIAMRLLNALLRLLALRRANFLPFVAIAGAGCCGANGTGVRLPCC